MERTDIAELSLQQRIDITTAESTRDAWATWLEENLSVGSHAREIEIQASNLERIDFAGVQLLIALTTEIVDRGSAFRWTGVNEKLLEPCRSLALTEQLGLVASYETTEGKVQ